MKNPRTMLLALAGLLGLGGLVWLLASGGSTPAPGPGDGPGRGEPVAGGPEPVPGPATGTGAAEPAASPLADLPKTIRRVKERVGREINASFRELLAVAGTAEGVVALEEILRSDPDPDLGSLVLMALAAGPFEAGRAIVREAAVGGCGEKLRATGLLLLGEDGSRENSQLLANVAGSGEDVALVSAALGALAFQHTPAAHRALADTLRLTGDPARRRLVWMAISGEPLPPPEDEILVRQELRRSHFGVLTELPEDPESSKAVEEIIRYALAEKDPSARMYAAAAMVRMPGESTVEPLREMWATLPVPMKHNVIGRARGDWSGPKVPEIIELGSQDSSPQVRMILAQRVSELAAPDELPALESWKDREADPEIRKALEGSIAAIRAMWEPR